MGKILYPSLVFGITILVLLSLTVGQHVKDHRGSSRRRSRPHPVLGHKRHRSSSSENSPSLPWERSNNRWYTHGGEPETNIDSSIEGVAMVRESCLWIVNKIDSSCNYTGYAGPAVFLGYKGYFISSMFTMAETVNFYCQFPYEFSWLLKPSFSRRDFSIVPTVDNSYGRPAFKDDRAKFVQRLGATELALFKTETETEDDEGIYVMHNEEFKNYSQSCFAISYQRLYDHSSSRMAQYKHPVYIEPHTTYKGFVLVQNILDRSNANLCDYFNRGSPIFCNGALAFIALPDDAERSCSKVYRAVSIKTLLHSLKSRDLSTQFYENLKRYPPRFNVEHKL